MTTSRITALTWPQDGSAGHLAKPETAMLPSVGVALIGVGAVLNVAWIGAVAFIAAKLTFF